MGIYGYCVVPVWHTPPSQHYGIAGASVRAHTIGDLCVWMSEVDRPDASIEHVKLHNQVVEAAVTRDVTPVPLRFGQWADNLAAFESAIAVRAAWYHERLHAFAGALEFGLRILDPKKEPARVVHAAEAVTGLDYMQGLRDRAAAAQAGRADADRASASVRDILGAYVREEKVEAAQSAHGLINVAHLVAHAHFDVYRAGAEKLTERHPELRFLLSGPWPPYSFAA